MKQKKWRQPSEALLIQFGSVLEAGGLVQDAIGSALRWGLRAVDDQGESYRDNLLRNLDDLKAAIRRLEKELASVTEVASPHAP